VKTSHLDCRPQFDSAVAQLHRVTGKLAMEIQGWDERYRSGDRAKEDLESPPNPLLLETAGRVKPGAALDLACGTGRNALWLAEHGWKVAAVDGAPAAIEILRRRALERGLDVEASVTDLEKGVYKIEEAAWDLIVMCFYLQRSLFEPAKKGTRPGGLVLAIVHISEPGQQPTEHQLRPGELEKNFRGWEILHYREGSPNDPAHKRISAEIVARRP
jgi:tellurite methyltransferase